jgi:hypothetical protein
MNRIDPTNPQTRAFRPFFIFTNLLRDKLTGKGRKEGEKGKWPAEGDDHPKKRCQVDGLDWGEGNLLGGGTILVGLFEANNRKSCEGTNLHQIRQIVAHLPLFPGTFKGVKVGN